MKKKNLSLLCMGFYLRLMRHGAASSMVSVKKRWKSDEAGAITQRRYHRHTQVSVYKAAVQQPTRREREKKRCTQVCCIPLGQAKEATGEEERSTNRP